MANGQTIGKLALADATRHASRPCHGERSEAISHTKGCDCFVAALLAMT
jgi:hypothetical protein